MPLKASKTPKQQVKKIRQFHRRMPKRIGGTAVSWFKQNFRRQGFPEGEGRFHKWKRRKAGAPRNKGRGILLDTGSLKRSINLIAARKNYVAVGSDLSYAATHNEGKTIRHPGGTPYIVKKDGKVQFLRKDGNYPKSVQFTKPHDITIPQRQFMGNSQALNKRLRRMITQELRKALS